MTRAQEILEAITEQEYSSDGLAYRIILSPKKLATYLAELEAKIEYPDEYCPDGCCKP